MFNIAVAQTVELTMNAAVEKIVARQDEGFARHATAIKGMTSRIENAIERLGNFFVQNGGAAVQNPAAPVAHLAPLDQDMAAPEGQGIDRSEDQSTSDALAEAITRQTAKFEEFMAFVMKHMLPKSEGGPASS